MTPFNDAEHTHVTAISSFIRRDTDPFDRMNFGGQVTGWGFLLLSHVLLTHHTALDRRLQFGGHADGEADIRSDGAQETSEGPGQTDVTFAPMKPSAIPPNALCTFWTNAPRAMPTRAARRTRQASVRPCPIQHSSGPWCA